MHVSVDMLIMATNYSHDIATAFLAVSGLMMWMFSRALPLSPDPAVERYYVRGYQGMIRVAAFSLVWILVAGVPRIIFYGQYEWVSTAGDLQVLAIIIKHIVMFLIVGTGLFFWFRLDKQVRYLKIKQNSS